MISIYDQHEVARAIGVANTPDALWLSATPIRLRIAAIAHAIRGFFASRERSLFARHFAFGELWCAWRVARMQIALQEGGKRWGFMSIRTKHCYEER